MTAVTRSALLACLAALSACATAPPSCEPFRVAWYLGPEAAGADPAAAAAPAVYLALLNEGQADLQIDRVVVNPVRSGTGASSMFGVSDVEPGGLRLFRVDGALQRCRLPVAVTLYCKDGGSRFEPVSGALPNYLHQHWVERCVADWKGAP